ERDSPGAGFLIQDAGWGWGPASMARPYSKDLRDRVVGSVAGGRSCRATAALFRQLIRAAGAKLFFLPRYSPDLNPIEQVFSKLKTLLRKADARSIEATWKQIGALLDRFTPEECANYLVNAGYASA